MNPYDQVQVILDWVLDHGGGLHGFYQRLLEWDGGTVSVSNHGVTSDVDVRIKHVKPESRIKLVQFLARFPSVKIEWDNGWELAETIKQHDADRALINWAKVTRYHEGGDDPASVWGKLESVWPEHDPHSPHFMEMVRNERLSRP